MFLAYKGNAFLLPAFLVVGFILGFLIGEAFVGFLCAIVGVWVYVIFLGKTKVSQAVNPNTGQPFLVYNKPTLYWMPVQVSAVIATVLLGFMAFVTRNDGDVERRTPGESLEVAGSNTGEKAFDAANDLLSEAGGAVSFGNGKGGATLARSFSQSMEQASGSDSDFRTYCRVTVDGNLLFLVRVPGLRKFNKEEKRNAGTTAWQIAEQLSMTLDPKPTRIGIGIRGIAMYSESLVGASGQDPQRHGKTSDPLVPMFTKPASTKIENEEPERESDTESNSSPDTGSSE